MWKIWNFSSYVQMTKLASVFGRLWPFWGGGLFGSFSATISYFEHPMWDQFDWGVLAQSGKFPSDRCDTLEKI